jgi:Domain of unknown function (DUF4382)
MSFQNPGGLPVNRLAYLGIASILGAAMFFGCSSNSSTPTASTATAKVSLSDPATCKGPGGPFSHVYIAVTDVKASMNANAGDNDSSFVDLTPGLSTAPKQVDLLGNADTNCFLAMLGDTAELQAGSYQQIRILLEPDSNASQVANNKCGSFSNCVVLNDGSVHDLQLSSEAKTGIKIPSGQIAGGAFTIKAGETKDLDLDFSTCASIVQEGNGQYRLKPVLHAGEVSLSSTSINGSVVSSSTGKALVGGTVTVALEGRDSFGVDRILMETIADATGGFVFCPLPAGTYDVVVVAIDGAGLSYSAAALTGISPGQTTGKIPLVPSTLQASIKGMITTQNTSGGTPADVAVTITEPVGGSGLVVTIPQVALPAMADAGLIATAPSASCSAGTDCANYTLLVPGVEPNLGAYSASGATFTQSSTLPVDYNVDAFAFVPMSGGLAYCTPSELKTSSTTSNSPIAVITGSMVTAATLSFTGCQ